MKRFVITEQEKEDILGQHQDMNLKPEFPEDRRITDYDITPMTLAKFKSQGLTPYFYDGDTDIVEITGPIKRKIFDTKPVEVFLLTPDEYDKIKKLTDNIKEMIDLKLKSIKLYKQYIPGSLMKIIEKK